MDEPAFPETREAGAFIQDVGPRLELFASSTSDMEAAVIHAALSYVKQTLSERDDLEEKIVALLPLDFFQLIFRLCVQSCEFPILDELEVVYDPPIDISPALTIMRVGSPW